MMLWRPKFSISFYEYNMKWFHVFIGKNSWFSTFSMEQLLPSPDLNRQSGNPKVPLTDWKPSIFSKRVHCWFNLIPFSDFFFVKNWMNIKISLCRYKVWLSTGEHWIWKRFIWLWFFKYHIQENHKSQLAIQKSWVNNFPFIYIELIYIECTRDGWSLRAVAAVLHLVQPHTRPL